MSTEATQNDDNDRVRYDAIVIGSGAGGGTLAYQLAKHNLRVLLIEQGRMLRPNWRSPDEIGVYRTRVEADDSRNSYLGGETKFYGSALYRMRESDFQAVEHENGISPEWPIRYSDLEPYYERAEQLYRVHGASENDASEPPRRKPFPFPPIAHSAEIAHMVRRIETSGARVSSIPRGLDYGAGGKCVLCPTCDGYYCQLDAKMDSEVAAVRPAIATGNLSLVTEAQCERVLTAADGLHVTGVLYRHKGVEKIALSDVVAVCAGLSGTTRLLLRSRTQKHLNGLGNSSHCLGRYLAGHSVGLVFPITSLKRMPPAHTKTFAINGYYHGAPGWPYPVGVIQAAGQMPIWENAAGLIRPIVKFVSTRALTSFYMTEALPTRDSGFVLEGDEIVGHVPPLHNMTSFRKLRRLTIDVFKRAGFFVVAPRRAPRSWHEVGTARFGADPATSVVDPNCQVHGIKGLFVVDASVLPSAGAVNTALTIMALALRAGDHIGAGYAGR